MLRRLPRLLAAGALGGDSVTFLLRDEFTTARTAGNVDGTSAEPGPGTRTVDDTGANISIEEHYFDSYGGTGVWNDPVLTYDKALNRGAGAMYAVVRLSLNSLIVGLFLNTSLKPVAPGTNGYGWQLNSASGAQYVLGAIGGSPGVIRSGYYSRKNTDHLIVVLPRPDGGAFVFVSEATLAAYPLARIIWVSSAGTGTPLYPAVSSFTDGVGGQFGVSEIGLIDSGGTPSAWRSQWGLATDHDTFARADGALGASEGAGAAWVNLLGTCVIDTQKIRPATLGADNYTASVIETGQSDGWFEVDYTVPESDGFFGIIFRCVDADNYWRIMHRSSNNTVYLHKRLSGENSSTTTPLTLSAGTTHRIRVVCSGSTITCFIDDIFRLSANSADMQTATRAGVFSYNNLTALGDNFAVWPLTVTLPETISFPIAAPVGDAIIQTDTFSGVNGTALETHNALWTIGAGSWEIDNNAVRQTTAGATGHATMDAGTPDHEGAVTIVVPAGEPVVNDWIPSVLCRYTDANNWILARLLYQSNSPEIEVFENIGGSVGFVDAVNLGAGNLAPGSTQTLIFAVRGEECAVYLNGTLRLQCRTSIATGNRAGIGTMAACEGQPTYDTWILKTT